MMSNHRLNENFRRDPLELDGSFDPYNEGFVMGLHEYQAYWSLDPESPLRALTNLRDGVDIVGDRKFDLVALFGKKPKLILHLDERTNEWLRRRSSEVDLDPPTFVARALGLEKVEIEVVAKASAR